MEFKLNIAASYKTFLEKNLSSSYSIVLESLVVLTHKNSFIFKHKLQIIS